MRKRVSVGAWVSRQMKIAIHTQTNKFATHKRPALRSFPFPNSFRLSARERMCVCVIVWLFPVWVCVDALGAIHLLLLPFLLVAAAAACCLLPTACVGVSSSFWGLCFCNCTKRPTATRWLWSASAFLLQNMATLAKRWRKSSLPFCQCGARLWNVRQRQRHKMHLTSD